MQMPDVSGVEHRFVDVGEVRLHVAEAGAGPPLVLLHGWPQHWWSWRHLIPKLAEEYRVLAPDLRGWGWSDAPPGEYRKTTFAQDILGLIDREGLDRVRLIGHDWGGVTSFLLARDAPERIERMVTLDIAPPWSAKPRPRHVMLPLLLSYQMVVATPGLGVRSMTQSNRFIRTIIRLASRSGFTDADLDVYADVLREPARARASSACYRTFLTRELPEAIRNSAQQPRLEVPTLLLMGGASPLQRVLDPQPEHNLEVELIPGAGHFLPEERPEEVLSRARAFLAG